MLGDLTGEVLQTSISVVISTTTATGILPRKGAALPSGPERIPCKRTIFKGMCSIAGQVRMTIPAAKAAPCNL